MIERYELAKGRIEEITTEQTVNETYRDYFAKVAAFALKIINTADWINSGLGKDAATEVKKNTLSDLYDELANHYDTSYLNPRVAVKELGDMGQVLSAIYAELISTIVYAYESNLEAILVRLELFLEVYSEFSFAEADGETPSRDAVIGILKAFAYDYLGSDMEAAVCDLLLTDNGVAGRIITSADLNNTDYLYDYGEYITDNEVKTASYLAKVSDEVIDRMARTFTEGYRIGFVAGGKDLSIKETVEIRYPIGFERVVRRAMEIFHELGLNTSFRRATPSFIRGRRLDKIGYFGGIANKQFECDHEYDKVLYFDKKYMERKLEAYHNALEKVKTEAGKFGGPAVIECFGEEPFAPVSGSEILKPDSDTQKLITEYNVRAANLMNQYVKGEERSFTIIAFPVPAIGDKFEEIFDETIRINTLDYELYQNIQQKIIDTLDKCKMARIEGTNGNETDLTVMFYDLKDPDKETIFENCVADVNIPVGEVFTSPKLEGTMGVLHVKDVYLNGLPYKNLKLRLTDGMIADYSCDNYDSDKDNQDFIREHLLFQHESLPIGEFAIGTNTTAYVMSRKYGLESIMPILIAEKTGPHFAMGDTCYSHEEDSISYNPDGKAIVARENSVSALRNTDPLKAYFGCHTDITIPYDELGRLYAVAEDGSEYDIIRDGRFVLEGTEALNEPLDKKEE